MTTCGQALKRDAPKLALPGRRAGDAISGGVNAGNYRFTHALRQAPFNVLAGRA